MSNASMTQNLLFQSEQHPLVELEFESREKYLLSLIHRKAYERAAAIAEGLDVLDLGCNNGYGTATMAARAERVVGVDVSPSAVEAAKVRHSAPNIEYRLVDGAVLPFADANFDLVTSFQVIEHVDDVESYLREIKRVLRAGGQAIFTTPNRCIRLRKGQRPWNPFHMREYEAAELAGSLRSCFSQVTVEGLYADSELQGIELQRVRLPRMLGRSGLALLGALRSAKAKLLPQRGDTGQRQAELARFMQRWSLSDLHYRQDRLDSVLDLMARCAK